MTNAVPRFVRVNGALMIMSARVELGKVLDLAGPYEMKSEPGMEVAEFGSELVKLLNRAAEAAVVVPEELEPELRDRLLAAFPAAPQDPQEVVE